MQPERRQRGRPKKKRGKKTNHARRERPGAPNPGPSRAQRLDGVEGDNDPSDTGDPELWDPKAGLRPSPQDDWGSDGEMETKEDVPDGGAREVNGAMIDMMIGLDDYDERDAEWLPAKEQWRLEARKKGSQLSKS
jgi:hypothetical protein